MILMEFTHKGKDYKNIARASRNPDPALFNTK